MKFEKGDIINYYEYSSGKIFQDEVVSFEKIKSYFLISLKNNEKIYSQFVIKNISKNIEFFYYEEPKFISGQKIIFKNKEGIILNLGEINIKSHKKYYDIKTDIFYYRIREEDIILADSP